MPVLPILDENARLLRGNRAGIHVFSTMLYPSDERRRDAYVATVLQEGKTVAELSSPVSGQIAQLFYEFGGKNEIEDDALRQIEKGAIAGESLLCAIQLMLLAPERASLRRAQHIVEKFRLGRKFDTRLNFPASRTPIGKAWKPFKQVSHLWAAWIPWFREARGEYVFSDDGLPDILADARWFADAAISLRAKRARITLLDPDEIWQIPESPDIPTVELKPPNLSETEHQWLAEQ